MDLNQKSPDFFVFVCLRLTEMMNASFCLFWSAKKVQQKTLPKNLSWGGYFPLKIQVIKNPEGQSEFSFERCREKSVSSLNFFLGGLE